MNLERTFTSALVVAALALAVPADAQNRAGTRQRGSGRATASAPAPRQGGGQRAVPRAQARQSGPQARQSAPQARQNSPRASARPQYAGPARGPQYGGQAGSPRAYQSRPYQGPRAVPRPPYYSNVRPGYPGGSYNARPYYARPYYGRPYYYAHPYPRPYYYAPYRPYYFPSPYYTFRPHLSIGFGLFIGNPVPYPYAYMGSYTPRVYGYAPQGAYDVQPGVPVHGGVSFDIQPSDADIFVDGEYVGPVGTFTPNTEPLTLTPGVHRIAVQRDGFRSMEWEVTIEPGQVIPYRGAMTRY